MTLSQLKYIIALEQHRHFGQAADACFITQPSLSMQIQKLENELSLKLFTRNNPVVPTEAGRHIIEQAKKIMAEVAGVEDMVQHFKNEKSGVLKLGIIPTLAPYLLPLFLQDFLLKYPAVKLSVTELRTDEIVHRLKNGTLDAGILATPLKDAALHEDILFYEEFVAYVSSKEKIFDKKYVLPADLDVSKLWLLEEGHCLRNQVLNFCALQKSSVQQKHFDYETGNIETLKRFVEQHGGITLLPELATMGLTATKHIAVKQFKNPLPIREISLVTAKSLVKKNLLSVLKDAIVDNVPKHMLQKNNKCIVEIHK